MRAVQQCATNCCACYWPLGAEPLVPLIVQKPKAALDTQASAPIMPPRSVIGARVDVVQNKARTVDSRSSEFSS